MTLDGGTPAVDVCVTLVSASQGCAAQTSALGQFVINDLMAETYCPFTDTWDAVVIWA